MPLSPCAAGLAALLVVGAAGNCVVSPDVSMDRGAVYPVRNDGVFFETTAGVTVGAATFSVSWSPCSASDMARVTAPVLNACLQPAFASIHNTAAQCLDSFETLQDGPTETLEGIRWVYASQTLRNLTVDVVCNPAGSVTDVSIVASASGNNAVIGEFVSGDPADQASYSNLQLTYSSRSACRLNEKVCYDSTTQAPTDPVSTRAVFCLTKACVSTVCADTGCFSIAKAAQSADREAANAALGVNFAKEFTVRDCTGTIVPGLGTDDFIVSVDDNEILPDEAEGALLVTPSAGGNSVKRIISLALDQSNSVVSDNEKLPLLVESVNSFLESLYSDSSTANLSNPYTGIFTFDGSADVIALKPSFSQSKLELLSTIGTLPQSPGDIHSTDIFGAVDHILTATEAAAASLSGVETPVNSAVENRLVQKSLVVFTDGADTAGRVAESVAVAAGIRFTRQNNTDLYFIDLSKTGDLQGFASQVTTPDNYFQVTQSSLATVFRDVGLLLSTTGAKYTVAICTPFRSNIHQVKVRINETKHPQTNPNTEDWFFNATDLQVGCNQQTLETAAGYNSVASPSELEDFDLPVLSRTATSIEVTATKGYFLVDTNGIVAGSSQVYLPRGSTQSLFLANGNGECVITTKYCASVNGTEKVTIPSAIGSADGVIMGLVVEADGPPVDATTPITLRLVASAAPPTMPPGVNMTAAPVPPAVTNAPTLDQGDDEDDDDAGVSFGVILLIILLVLLFLGAVMYLCYRNQQAAAAQQQHYQSFGPGNGQPPAERAVHDPRLYSEQAEGSRAVMHSKNLAQEMQPYTRTSFEYVSPGSPASPPMKPV